MVEENLLDCLLDLKEIVLSLLPVVLQLSTGRIETDLIVLTDGDAVCEAELLLELSHRFLRAPALLCEVAA